MASPSPTTGLADDAGSADRDEGSGDGMGGDRQRDGRSRRPSGPQLVALVLALCFLAGAVGFVVGRGRPPGRSSTDVAFLYDMLHHHEQAITMAQIEEAQGTEEGVQVFAREILLFQSYEIGLMDSILDRWGHEREDPPETAMGWMGHAMPPDEMPGMATAAELDELRGSEGSEADALFVELMQRHHEGGAEMAEVAAQRVADDGVQALARRLARNQRAEIAELEAARVRYGLPPATG